MDSNTCSQTPDDIPEALQCSTNIPRNSEHCFKAPKIFAELRRPLKTFAELQKPLETFANLRGSSDALYYLQTPSDTYPHLLDASWTLHHNGDLRRWIKRLTLDGEDLSPSHFCIRSA
jgi:hypothetical protein